MNQALQEANQKNDSVRMPKLQQIVAVLQQASAPPPELALLEELLDAPDEAALNKMLDQHSEEITPELVQLLPIFWLAAKIRPEASLRARMRRP